MFTNLFPGGSSAVDKLQAEVVDCEIRLAFYDDSTRSMLVLDVSGGSDYREELHHLVSETVRLEALVVSRHGSQLMRAPSFSRRPNSGMLTAPDGSGHMRACPTVESRLRLLRARLALAEHPSTLRTRVGVEDEKTQRKVIDGVLEQYTARLTYARWLLDALGREKAGEAGEGEDADAEGAEGSSPGAASDNGGLDVSALFLKPLQALLTKGSSPEHLRPSSASSTASSTTSAMAPSNRATGLFGFTGSSSNLAAAAAPRGKRGAGVLVTELDVLVQVRRNRAHTPSCTRCARARLAHAARVGGWGVGRTRPLPAPQPTSPRVLARWLSHCHLVRSLTLSGPLPLPPAPPRAAGAFHGHRLCLHGVVPSAHLCLWRHLQQHAARAAHRARQASSHHHGPGKRRE